MMITPYAQMMNERTFTQIIGRGMSKRVNLNSRVKGVQSRQALKLSLYGGEFITRDA